MGNRRTDAVVGPGETVHEAVLPNRLEDLARARREAEREVAAGRPLAGRQHVWPDAPMVDAEPSPRPAEPGHHLVRDQEDAVTPAHLGDGRPVVVGRDGRREGGAGDGLGDEGRDGGRTRLDDRALQAFGVPGTAPRRMAGVRAPELVGRVDVLEPSQPRFVRAPQRILATGVERGERVPVVRGTPSDHQGARRLTAGQMERSRELDRGLHGLAAARDRIDPRIVHGEQRRDGVRVGLQRVGRERRRVHVRGP